MPLPTHLLSLIVVSSTRRFVAVIALVVLGLSIGCEDNGQAVREIRVAQTRQRAQTNDAVNDLAEAFSLIERLSTLNEQTARRQIKFHLGRWFENHPSRSSIGGQSSPATTTADNPSAITAADSVAASATNSAATNAADSAAATEVSSAAATEVSSAAAPAIVTPELLDDIRDVVPIDQLRRRYGDPAVTDRDIDLLRDASLYNDIVAWVDLPDGPQTDPLLAPWLDALPPSSSSLATASRLFDWTVRNVARESLRRPSPIGVEDMPADMVYLGPGYRQSDYQTVFRGSGDWYNRAIVFIELCRQSGIPAAVLATTGNDQTSGDAGGVSNVQPEPWCAAAIVDGQAYLFDFELDLHIPGPGGVGIATLREARTDESVLRRMNVAGFFDYDKSIDDVQSCIALLPVTPEDMSPRMRTLQNALTGDLRLVCHVDIDSLRRRVDDAVGVADVRLWDVPIKVDLYREAVDRAADRNPQLAYLDRSAWMMLEAAVPSARQLALGRMRQLRGQFDDDPLDTRRGARGVFMAQRQPEFEIEDLRTDPQLQKRYDVRRMLGVSGEDYDRQIQFAQQLIRAGKRTATYWLSLLQYDDGQFDNAEDWLTQRVLDDTQSYIWNPSAKYLLARTYEKLGRLEEAIELYKTEGLPSEHGNRIRARLLQAKR